MDLFFNNADLYGDDRIVKIDDETIKYNDDDELYINQIDNINKIKVDEPYKILVSNNDLIPITILSKLTNDYIIDETINKIKIYGLTTDLNNIINKFLDYYTKIESNNLYYSKSYIDILINLYYTKV
jgi:hypothetical protein